VRSEGAADGVKELETDNEPRSCRMTPSTLGKRIDLHVHAKLVEAVPVVVDAFRCTVSQVRRVA